MKLQPDQLKRIVIFLVFGSIFLSTHPGKATQAPNPQQDVVTEKPPLVLGLGEQRIITLPEMVRFSLGSSIVRGIPLQKGFSKPKPALNHSLILKGISAGITDLWVWKSDGSSEHRTVRVEKNSHRNHNLGLEQNLSQLDETEIIYSGQGVVLRGVISHIQELFKVAAIVQGFKKEVHDETELSDELLQYGQNQLNQWIKEASYTSQLRIEVIGKSIWLRGSLERPQEQPSIQKQVRALFPAVQFDIETLPNHSPIVYFRVFLLELRKSEFRSLGLTWPSSVSGAFHIVPGQIQNLFQMDLALQQLEKRGNAKILSNPELVVRAPGEAELFAGGEIPIQNQSRFYSNISWKNYGLTLRLKVTHIAGERVRVDIFTEVSHLDQQIGQDKIPGIQSNRMKTQVDARFGVPLLLSGLLQQGVREEARGLPFLRGIPVLGLLFGSEDYLNERSELVAILYPHASPPHSTENLKSIFPKGPLPFPLDWISPEEERILRSSPHFPWNTLQ